MGVFVALAVGYVIGARTGSKDLDQVAKALKALSASDEFADVVSAVRSHLGHTLRELAGVIEGAPRNSRRVTWSNGSGTCSCATSRPPPEG